MSNIYERIGRAISSCGEYDIVRAETKEEIDILEGSGFKKVGSVLEGEKVISLYKIDIKTVEKIVQVPIITPTPPIDTTPWDKPWSKPWGHGTGLPWTTNIDNHRIMYGAMKNNITSDGTNVDTINYKGLEQVMSDLIDNVNTRSKNF